MIHLLEIHPGQSLKEIEKISRRYAMTGGYEIALAPGLNSEDLQKLFTLFAPEVESNQNLNSRKKSSNAYRILELIRTHENADSMLVEQLGKVLNGN